MDRHELLQSVLAASPRSGQVVYVERRGADYGWEAADDAEPAVMAGWAGAPPDVWIYYAGNWPVGDDARTRAVLDDLLAEMESMAGGDDRCRWPLAEPWPQGH